MIYCNLLNHWFIVAYLDCFLFIIYNVAINIAVHILFFLQLFLEYISTKIDILDLRVRTTLEFLLFAILILKGFYQLYSATCNVYATVFLIYMPKVDLIIRNVFVNFVGLKGHFHINQSFLPWEDDHFLNLFDDYFYCHSYKLCVSVICIFSS